MMRVDQDDRHGGLRQSGHVAIVGREGDYEDPIGPLAAGHVEDVVVTLLGRLDVVNNQVIGALGQGGFYAAQPLDEGRAGEERDDGGDREGLAQRKAAGVGAGDEVDLGDDVQHPLARGAAHQGAVVEHAGGSAEANPGFLGDVANGDGHLEPFPIWNRFHLSTQSPATSTRTNHWPIRVKMCSRGAGRCWEI